MQKKQREGVTLIILAVTVIVALVLLSTIIVSYDSIKNSMKKREFAKEIYTIQKLSDEYYLKNSSLATTGTTVTPSFSTSETFEELSLYNIGAEDVARGTRADGDTTDVYAVSLNTRKVYYIKGVEIGGNTYYTLTDELKKLLE